jgi:hypothetical protein
MTAFLPAGASSCSIQPYERDVADAFVEGESGFGVYGVDFHGELRGRSGYARFG